MRPLTHRSFTGSDLRGKCARSLPSKLSVDALKGSPNRISRTIVGADSLDTADLLLAFGSKLFRHSEPPSRVELRPHSANHHRVMPRPTIHGHNASAKVAYRSTWGLRPRRRHRRLARSHRSRKHHYPILEEVEHGSVRRTGPITLLLMLTAMPAGCAESQDFDSQRQ